MRTQTKRQHDVLEYLTDFITDRGYPPSYQQIARAIGVRSKGAIAKHIEALEIQGLISRTRVNGSFGIDLLPETSISETVTRIDWLNIPFPESHETLPQPEPLIIPNMIAGDYSTKSLRLFKVPNDSMRDEHILEGDIAIVEKRDFARDRDCVIALIDNERAVIQRFYRSGADIELRPANDAYSAIVLAADRIEILAIYKSLLRPFA